MKRILLLAICFVLLLSGCGANKETEQNLGLRFAYISKDLDHYWFQQVVLGIEGKCLELGIEYDTFDAHFDNETCMELVDYVIDQQYDGLMICASSQSLGPEIGQKCADAGIPVVTIDDNMLDHNGKYFSHIGMATREMGGIGGAALAKMAKEKGFFEEKNRVAILELTVNGLSVFRDRLNGYEEALLANTPITSRDIISITVPDGMYENNILALQEFFYENNLSDVTHWIVCGVNDDCALSCMHYLKQLGYDQEHVIGCGLGGYELSVYEFESGNTSYISVMLQPDIEGAQATEILYNYIQNGEPMTTSMMLGGKLATCDNYLVYFNYSKLAE